MTVCLVLQCLAITPPNAAGEGACIEFGPADVGTFQPGGTGSFTLPVQHLGYLEHFQVGAPYSFALDMEYTRLLWLQQSRFRLVASSMTLDPPRRQE